MASSFADYTKQINGVTVSGAYDTATGRVLDGNITSQYGAASAHYGPGKLSLEDYERVNGVTNVVPPGTISPKPSNPALPNEIIAPPPDALRRPMPQPTPAATFTSEPGENFTPLSNGAVPSPSVAASSFGSSTLAKPLDEEAALEDLIRRMGTHEATEDEIRRALQKHVWKGETDPDEDDFRSVPQFAPSTQRYYARKTLRVRSAAVAA